jgi:hypothetical protein
MMTDSDRLLAAVGRVDITPPIGIDMVGFAARGPSTGVHDPLTATALVLGCGETHAAVVACDLIDLDDDHVDAVTTEIHKRSGMTRENILFCCSHTHYGPRLGAASAADLPDDVKAYRANLNYILAGLIAETATRLVPVKVGVGKGSCDVNINRRERLPNGKIKLGKNPGGFVDREVIVVRIVDDEGRPIAALVNYACHGVCLGGRWRLISSDFPGALRQVVEEVTGAKALYLQGATGNMNPVLMGEDYKNPRSTGVKLAGEALKVWESIAPTEAHGLAVASDRVELPSLRFSSKDAAAASLETVKKELAQLQSGSPQPGHVRWLKNRIERAEAALKSWETGEPLPPITDRIHAIRFGPVALASSAGEVFAQIGVEVKRRSPLADTLFAAYTNGDIGYVPTPDAYVEGGYEVEHACRVDPPAAQIITEGCLRLVDRVAPPKTTERSKA